MTKNLALRHIGTNDWVATIDLRDNRYSPPGSVNFVTGADHPNVMIFQTRVEAKAMAEAVWEIELFKISIEVIDD
jgi:hypothetical protein